MSTRPPVVVQPPASDGGRQVTIRGEPAGIAYSLFDVLDLVHRAGLPGEDRAVDDPELIEWLGGGPYDWNSTDTPDTPDAPEKPESPDGPEAPGTPDTANG